MKNQTNRAVGIDFQGESFWFGRESENTCADYAKGCTRTDKELLDMAVCEWSYVICLFWSSGFIMGAEIWHISPIIKLHAALTESGLLKRFLQFFVCRMGTAHREDSKWFR